MASNKQNASQSRSKGPGYIDIPPLGRTDSNGRLIGVDEWHAITLAKRRSFPKRNSGPSPVKTPQGSIFAGYATPKSPGTRSIPQAALVQSPISPLRSSACETMLTMGNDDYFSSALAERPQTASKEQEAAPQAQVQESSSETTPGCANAPVPAGSDSELTPPASARGSVFEADASSECGVGNDQKSDLLDGSESGAGDQLDPHADGPPSSGTDKADSDPVAGSDPAGEEQQPQSTLDLAGLQGPVVPDAYFSFKGFISNAKNLQATQKDTDSDGDAEASDGDAEDSDGDAEDSVEPDNGAPST